MPTLDQRRLAASRQSPRIVELWRALRPLGSILRVMNSGAHPDDEISSMLAALAWRDGVNLSYACSTRGEGGQNDIGTQNGPALGALRIREMERACDILDMRLYWHSTGPDDPIRDFRFSKSGTETLGIWGHDRLLHRFVEIVRTERPDILIPTFLDVPGQHGHHRAMTQAAHEVMQAAADPAFGCDLPVWQVAKLYLPAWSGAGQAYDDDLPPPPATLEVDGTGDDPVTGWSYARIGQMSRACHRTQGMGQWVPPGQGRSWPLHLAESHVDGPDTGLGTGLAGTLADLAQVVPAVAPDLQAAQCAMDEALAAFPDTRTIVTASSVAFNHVQTALAACPDTAKPRVAHHLTAKLHHLARVIRIASGAEVHALGTDTWLRPGAATQLTVESNLPQAALSLGLPDGWSVADEHLAIAPDAPVTWAYRTTYDPANPPVPRVAVTVNGATSHVPFTSPPVVLPARVATPVPDRLLINTATTGRSVAVTVTDVAPAEGTLSVDLPEGWRSTVTGTTIRLDAPPDVAPGLYTVPLRVNGELAQTETRIAHDHIDATAHVGPATITVRVAAIAVADARIGYVGSGHDSVAHSLRAMGATVAEISDLTAPMALDGIDTLVIGIFALRFRDGLLAQMPRIRAWVEAGGTLVTLYHRPWDNWNPDQTPPRRIEIGQPSLRWRVTDAAAPVTMMADHAVLTTPNRIDAQDWDGWVKERGLYFARDWDPVYTPLLSMADPDEAPLTGALLVGDIGKGRHVHCSLILHLQMAHLVPGAFRLMANLVTPRS